MKVTEKQIKYIADSLDCGMHCFFHKESNKIVELPDFLNGGWLFW